MRPYYSDSLVTIYHADSLSVLPELSGIGAVITDPPYSSGGAFRSDRTRKTLDKYVDSSSHAQTYLPEFSGDMRDQRGFFAWCTLWLSFARAASVVGAPLCAFTDWRQLPTLTDAIQSGGWVWRNIATWWKPGIRMQRGMFSSSAEYVVFGTNGERVDHDGAPQNVFKCAPERDREHIAEKPLQVMAWILGVVPRGALIVDPFCGSGTTLRAAKDRGYRCIGIDTDEHSCEMSAEKCRQETLTLGVA